MNKGEFIAFIAENNKCTKTDAEKALDMVISGITSAVAEKKDISLVGFGSFSVQKREARKGRNPKTGAELDIPAYNQPVFKAGKGLKDACNV